MDNNITLKDVSTIGLGLMMAFAIAAIVTFSTGHQTPVEPSPALSSVDVTTTSQTLPPPTTAALKPAAAKTVSRPVVATTTSEVPPRLTPAQEAKIPSSTPDERFCYSIGRTFPCAVPESAAMAEDYSLPSETIEP